MVSRVTIIQGSPQKIEEGIKNFRETTLPAAKKLTGFRGAYLLVDRKTGKGMAITLWDTEANLKASAEAVSRLRAQGAQAAGMTQPPIVEVYEVAVQP